jgi:polysaccharide export outer membrane protein
MFTMLLRAPLFTRTVLHLGVRVLPLLAVFGSTLVVRPLAGQTQEQARRTVEQQLGRSVSHAEIIDQLRQAGLSREQVRARLQQMGYDPDLADPYFDAMERGGGAPQGEASGDLLRTLREIGIAVRGAGVDTIPTDGRLGDSLRVEAVRVDSLAPGELPIFGRELFQRATSQFQPVVSGPVDPGYRLGPGDQIALILTGDVETAYTLDVTREGYVVIPDVGQVFVNGLTLRELEDRLYTRLGAVYSGVGRGPGATAHFQVSLGKLRTNQVFIIGEVERPGAYQVSSVATAFNALYEARGPNRNGSFRRIEVRRGGEVIRTIDLYDYLLHGDSRDDIRLEQGDVIFVPLVGAQVGIRGAVRRPATYEPGADDGLRDLLRYAGRLEAGAVVRRVQIDRILPPDSRRPGVDRVLVDVELQNLFARDGESIPLRDGDIVQVFSVSDERRNRLTLTGEVNRPGVYEWAPGITIWDVIDRGGGARGAGLYPPRPRLSLEPRRWDPQPDPHSAAGGFCWPTAPGCGAGGSGLHRDLQQGGAAESGGGGDRWLRQEPGHLPARGRDDGT